jgi:hypothetical protein
MKSLYYTVAIFIDSNLAEKTIPEVKRPPLTRTSRHAVFMNKPGEQRPQQKGRKRRFSSGKRDTHWDSSITGDIIEKADRLHSGFTFSAPPLKLNLFVYPRVPRMDGQAR